MRGQVLQRWALLACVAAAAAAHAQSPATAPAARSDTMVPPVVDDAPELMLFKELPVVVAAAKRERSNRAPAPDVIETGAQHVVQQVVAMRDRIEHRADAFRLFVAAERLGASRHRSTRPVHAGNSRWSTPSTDRILPAMKSARSSIDFGSW